MCLVEIQTLTALLYLNLESISIKLQVHCLLTVILFAFKIWIIHCNSYIKFNKLLGFEGILSVRWLWRIITVVKQ